MWRRAHLLEAELDSLEIFEHEIENVILFYRNKSLICVSINRSDLYVIACQKQDPPDDIAVLYIDFAKKYCGALHAGVGLSIGLDAEGYFESNTPTPWDDHPLFCGKKITAQIRQEVSLALPQPIAEEIHDHIRAW